ncbi:hypothetical protein L211DRAFT_780595 [Terfezia boudieri ATCC MYA-4762]|uniref:Myb-like domain-containing protein n=1 Tax=Terfezia boudieri ATCC MYA-4762 TaxID=1051890 RepID=A0A3N4M1L0_9PEZI|nr:hypothetical protein L211DRAFT_780595 [Terfezia boudieri ATCC MYA-4762]
MLLPSALSCDGGRVLPSSSTSMLLSPVPRHATLSIPQVALFAHTPAIDREDASLRTSAVEGIFMTCKKLHQILSLEPPRSASPSVLAVPSVSQAPQTPTPRKSNVLRVPKTPMRRNKRRQSDVDSDQDDGFYHIPVQSQKRPRLTTLSELHQPSPHKESLQMEMEITPSAQADNSARDWSNAEDRLLVEMVLQKMRLSPRDWADCARSLGRDPRAVGNRWEMIVESLMGGATGAAPKRKMLEDSERR